MESVFLLDIGSHEDEIASVHASFETAQKASDKYRKKNRSVQILEWKLEATIFCNVWYFDYHKNEFIQSVKNNK